MSSYRLNKTYILVGFLEGTYLMEEIFKTVNAKYLSMQDFCPSMMLAEPNNEISMPAYHR